MSPVSNRDRSAALTRRVAFMGLLFAIAIVLSYVENMISVGLFLPLGIKLGLSNIVVMYALFFFGKPSAYTLAVLKSLFVFLVRGPLAGVISLSGGLVSLTAMVLLLWLTKGRVSRMLLSVCGATFHNLGQIAVAAFLLDWGAPFFLAYLPGLLLTGMVMGVLTSLFLQAILPALGKLGLQLTGGEAPGKKKG